MNTQIAKDMLDPEIDGFSVSAEERDEARRLLGMDAVETKSLHNKFIYWLYTNYPIGNGDRLIELEESRYAQALFLSEMGLPEDTVIA